MHIVEIFVAGERLLLHPFRALFWPRERWLVVSDMHLGKAAHFRKSGTPLPEGQDAATLLRLDVVMETFQPDRVLILGDLFHSSLNNQWQVFQQWANAQQVPLQLVTGNHDILASEHYEAAGLQVTREPLIVGPFAWVHQPMDTLDRYSIAGHIHPGVVLKGAGSQRLKLPCFLIGERSAILPAFGMSTGLYVVKPTPTDSVYSCTERAVLDVSHSFAGSSQRTGN